MTSLKWVGALLAVGILIPACTGGSGDTHPGGATDQEVTECKNGCDQAKFFQCSDAAGLSKCYDDCNSASPAQIDKFNGCSQTSICDPSCRSLIDPPSGGGNGSGSGSGGGSGGGGVDQADCQSACTKIITTCNFAPVGAMDDCVSQCESQGYQYQIDCVNNNACSDIQSRCGGSLSGPDIDAGGGGDFDAGDIDVTRCQDDCKALHGMTCITADELTSCNNDCNTAGAARTNFESCEETSTPDTCYDCYTSFNGG